MEVFMFRKSYILASLIIGSLVTTSVMAQNPPPHQHATEQERRSMFFANLAFATFATYSNKNGGFSDAFSLFSNEMNAFLLTEILSKTSFRDYTIPLVFTALHGKHVIDFGVASFKGALMFHAAYKKAYGKTSGWMSMYAKRFIPLTIKRGVVGLGMKGIEKGAQAVGISYPEWVRGNMWYMHFARQIPLVVQDIVGNWYDMAVNTVFSAAAA